MESLTACEEHTWIQKSLISLIQSNDGWQFSSLGSQRKQEIKKKKLFNNFPLKISQYFTLVAWCFFNKTCKTVPVSFVIYVCPFIYASVHQESLNWLLKNFIWVNLVNIFRLSLELDKNNWLQYKWIKNVLNKSFREISKTHLTPHSVFKFLHNKPIELEMKEWLPANR